MAQEVNIKFNATVPDVAQPINQFKELKKSMRDAIGELAGLEEGTEAYVNQAAKVGKIKDQINDLNDSIRNTSGAPIENLTNSFGLLQGQVSSLDFGGATNSLKQIGANIGGINIKSLTSGFKDFGKELLNTAKAILSNPIFLIAAAIAAIVYAIYTFTKANKELTQSLEDVNEQISLQEKLFGDLNRSFDNYTALALEKLKQRGAAEEELNEFTVKRNKEKIDRLRQQEEEFLAEKEAFEAGFYKRTEELDGEDLKRENDKRKAISEAYEKSKDARVKFAEQASIQEEQLRTKSILKQQEEERRAREKRVADEAKLRQDIAAIEQNAFLASIKNEEIRENTAAQLKKDARDRDIEATKASQSVKNEALKASELQLQTDLAAIKASYDAKRKAEEDKRNEELMAEQERVANEMLAAEDRAYQVRQERLSARQENETLLAEGNRLNQLRVQSEHLKEQYQLDIENARRTGADIEVINQQYANKKIQLAQQVQAEEKRLADQQKQAFVQAQQQALNAAQNLSNAYFNVKLAQAKGNIEEENRLKKKQFDIDKAFAITRATIDGARSVVAALTVPPPAGPILAGVNAAAAAAQIAVIATQQFTPSTGGSGGGSTVSAPPLGRGGMTSPSPSPSSQAFNPQAVATSGIQMGRQEDSEVQKARAQRVYVLESDIRDVTKKVSLYESRATFGK